MRQNVIILILRSDLDIIFNKKNINRIKNLKF